MTKIFSNQDNIKINRSSSLICQSNVANSLDEENGNYQPNIYLEKELLKVTDNNACCINANREFALKSLKCSICNKEYATNNSYNRHLKIHNVSRPYVCDKCDKSFKTLQVLSDHLKRHYNDRRHGCTLCGQKFYAKSNLTDHMRSHSGEKPFKCSICERAFGTKATLRQHQIVSVMLEYHYNSPRAVGLFQECEYFTFALKKQ